MRLKQALIVTVLVLTIVLVSYILIGNIVTWHFNNDPRNSRFEAGRAPEPPLDGDYIGTADGQGSWLGKSFTAESQRGINRFAGANGTIDLGYAFVTYNGKGLNNPNTNVLKIDYNLPENPFYIRWILDEVVEVAPGRYLGKVHLRVLPFVPFTLSYFELR